MVNGNKIYLQVPLVIRQAIYNVLDLFDMKDQAIGLQLDYSNAGNMNPRLIIENGKLKVVGNNENGPDSLQIMNKIIEGINTNE